LVYVKNSIEPGSPLSREILGAFAPESAPAQDLAGGNVVWESTCPSMNAIIFPLFQ